MVTVEQLKAVLASSERREGAVPCELCPFAAAFRFSAMLGWAGWSSQTWQQFVDPVAHLLGAAYFPTGGVRVPPNRVPTPNDCAPWRPHDSIAQTALGFATAAVPTRAIVCQSESRVLAQNARHIPVQSEPGPPPDLQSIRTDLPPDLWRSETLGYTISEGEQGHAKNPKDLYCRI